MGDAPLERCPCPSESGGGFSDEESALRAELDEMERAFWHDIDGGIWDADQRLYKIRNDHWAKQNLMETLCCSETEGEMSFTAFLCDPGGETDGLSHPCRVDSVEVCSRGDEEMSKLIDMPPGNLVAVDSSEGWSNGLAACATSEASVGLRPTSEPPITAESKARPATARPLSASAKPKVVGGPGVTKGEGSTPVKRMAGSAKGPEKRVASCKVSPKTKEALPVSSGDVSVEVSVEETEETESSAESNDEPRADLPEETEGTTDPSEETNFLMQRIEETMAWIARAHMEIDDRERAVEERERAVEKRERAVAEEIQARARFQQNAKRWTRELDLLAESRKYGNKRQRSTGGE